MGILTNQLGWLIPGVVGQPATPRPDFGPPELRGESDPGMNKAVQSNPDCLRLDDMM